MQKKIVAENVTLYLADCYDVIELIGRVDALISDPPYGINYVRGKRPRRSGWHRGGGADRHAGIKIIGDNYPFDPAPFVDLANDVILWGADHFYPRLPACGRFLAWNKLGNRLNGWDSFCDVEFAWHSAEGAARIFNWQWKGIVGNKHGENNSVRDHPTQKPIALMRWCISQCSGPAKMILDPFMGAGTTGVAAVQLGRGFIGVEIEERYFKVALQRIGEARRQDDLFFKLDHAGVQQTLL